MASPPRGGFQARFASQPVLLIAFAFAIVGDPVSSVAYAIEAAVRALGGNLALLLPTMVLVLGIIALVALNYHQLYARFPEGGGDAAASAAAFSEGMAFLPLASLIVDYALTITISVAAGASALIAYLPPLAPMRVPLALALVVLVAGLTWFGHGGRAIFAAMTISFALVGTIVILRGIGASPLHPATLILPSTAHRSAPLAVLLAFPVAMALATGVEAPSSAIAQLAQLDDAGRLRCGRVTLWLMLAIVIWLTLGLTVLAVKLHVGLPPSDTTLIAEVAQTAVGRGPLFALFQLSSTVLLLAAASSSFQAGPGLLKALARGGGGVGILPGRLARTNRHHTPYWGVAVFLAVSVGLVMAAGGQEQRLVLFYAVAVFIAFLCGLLSMTKFFWRDRTWGFFAVSFVGALAVALTLVVNLTRGYPIVSLVAALGIAGILYTLWVRAGRPSGVSQIGIMLPPHVCYGRPQACGPSSAGQSSCSMQNQNRCAPAAKTMSATESGAGPGRPAA